MNMICQPIGWDRLLTFIDGVNFSNIFVVAVENNLSNIPQDANQQLFPPGPPKKKYSDQGADVE
jgi:hypothetical protein